MCAKQNIIVNSTNKAEVNQGHATRVAISYACA